MQTTASDLIRGALSILGVLANGEAIPGDDAQSCLDILNGMVDSWNTERLNIFTVQEHVATLTGQTLTIGPGMDIDVPRPTMLEDTCFTRYIGVDYPMRRVNGAQYSSITLKSITSTFPYYVYYDADAPTGLLYFWPLPPSAVEVHIRLQNQLSEFPDLGTAFDLPQGYKRAIMYSLAEELAPQYRPLDPSTARIAAKARRNIKRVNTQNNVLDMPAAISGNRMGFNIYTGS